MESGRIGEIREDDEDKEVDEPKDTATVEDYSKFDGVVKAVEEDLRQNPLTSEEKQEINNNIDDAFRVAEEAFEEGKGSARDVPRPAEEPSTLEEYSRFDDFVEAVSHDLEENPLTPQEKQEVAANVEDVWREAETELHLHRFGEDKSPPDERIVEEQTSPDSLQEQQALSQDAGEPAETSVEPNQYRRIDNLEEYQQALRAFPDETEPPDFPEMDYQVREFFNIRSNFPKGAPVDFIAAVTDIPADVVQKWTDGEERPEFLTKLEQRAIKAGKQEPQGISAGSLKPPQLPDSVRERVSDDPDIEFLSRLSKNWDTLHEMEMTDTAFERIEEIASKHFRFSDSTYEILRATEDTTLRAKIIPAKGTPLTEIVKATTPLIDNQATNQLLEKVTQTNGNFIIDSWENYELVIRALPLTLAEPNFEALHREIKGRLLLGDCIGHTKAREYGKTEVSDKRGSYFAYTRKNLKALEKIEWFCNNQLEQIVERHRRLEHSGIRTIADVQERLGWYYGGSKICSRSTYQRELGYTKRHLVVYPLRRLGLRVSLLKEYDTQDIRINRYILQHDYLNFGFNSVLELAVQIPKEAPENGWQWVETLRRPQGKGVSQEKEGWIQIPVKVQSDNIDKVVERLGIPTKPEESEHFFNILKEHGVSKEQYTEWKEKYGQIETHEQKMDAFAYLIGAMLSDGTVHFSNQALLGAKGTLRLSSSYPWSKDMGEYFTYCWCSLGIASGPKQYPSGMTELFPVHQWNTGISEFFDWYHKEALGLPEGGTHTEHCSLASWISKMPETFRVAIIQGYFDGDGMVNAMRFDKTVRAATGTQTAFVRELLDSIGLETVVRRKGQKRYLTVKPESFEKAVKLPVFRLATGRQKIIQRINDTVSDRTATTIFRDSHNLHLERLIRKLGSNPNRHRRRINQLLYDFTGITCSVARITKIRTTPEDIDWSEVRAFIGFWKRNPVTGTISPSFRQACEEAGYQRSNNRQEYNWAKTLTVPSSVRRALSDTHPSKDGGWTIKTREGPPIHLDKEFLEHHPHIAEIITSYQSRFYKRVQKALENDLEAITSHPRLKKQVNKLTEQMEELTKTNPNLSLDERPDNQVQLLTDTMRTIQAIGKLREPVGVQHLTPLLEHNETRIKGVTVVALGKIGSTEAVDELLKTYPKHPLYLKEDTKQTKDLRALWIQALSRMRDQRAIDFLTEIRNDPKRQIRQAASKPLRQTNETQKPTTNH